MLIGTALFVYNRSTHTQRVLNALKNTYMLPQRLYIFHDGIRNENEQREWKKVQQIIEDIDWCEKEIIVSRKNKGLANSIIDGVNYVFEKNDAIIVLEDDCVPTRNFYNYMVQCLNYYYSEKKVYGISGYAWPIDLKPDDISDIYFTGRISSWGWSTWKDRWQKYKRDNSILNRIRHSCEKSIYLETWGSDLDSTLQSVINNKASSWAVYWALKCIEDGAVFVTPYLSLIHNIGHDGTGVNCDVNDMFEVPLEADVKKDYRLSNDIRIKDDAKKAFAAFLGSYTAIADNSEAEKKENVIIYGLGYYFRCNEKILNQRYSIVAVMDKKKTGYYAGKKIINKNEIQDCGYKIIVMLKDRSECENVRYYLERDLQVETDRIVYGIDIID